MDGMRQMRRRKGGTQELLTSSVREITTGTGQAVVVNSSVYLEKCITFRIWICPTIPVCEGIRAASEEANQAVEDSQGDGHCER